MPASRSRIWGSVMGWVRKATSPAGAPARASRWISPQARRTWSTEARTRAYQGQLRMSGETTRSGAPSSQPLCRSRFRSLAMSMTSATTAEAVGSLPAPRP